jgi:hypothetical protein
MDTEILIPAFILEFSDYLLAIIGSIALPLLDHSLITDRYYIRYFFYVVAVAAASDRSNILKRLIVYSIVRGKFSTSPLFPDRFAFFEVWQFVQLCLPMWTFIRGVEPDQKAFDFMGRNEGCLYIHFGPAVGGFF